jgi:hypothetical protein
VGLVRELTLTAELYLSIPTFLGDKLARGLIEAAPMAYELSSEFDMMDKAVTERDAKVHAEWEKAFDTWVGGDYSGQCPFQSLESKTRTYDFSS